MAIKLDLYFGLNQKNKNAKIDNSYIAVVVLHTVAMDIVNNIVVALLGLKWVGVRVSVGVCLLVSQSHNQDKIINVVLDYTRYTANNASY